EDIAQETCMVLTTQYANLDDETQLIKLGFKIAHYIHLRNQKRGLREVAAPEGWNPVSPDASPERRALMEQVRAVIKQLPDKDQELMKVFLDGYSAAEIKGMIGAASDGAVH